MSLFRKLCSLRPTRGQPLNAYFVELLDITTELTGSEEAVPNVVLKNHIYTTLPPAYAVTIEILQSCVKVTVQEVMDELNECETNRSVTTKSDTVSEALYSQQGGREGRGGYQGRYQGNDRSPKGWCDWCKTGTHTTANCWSKKNNKRARDQNDCYHCGEEGNMKNDCHARRKGQAVRNNRGNRRDRGGNGGNNREEKGRDGHDGNGRDGNGRVGRDGNGRDGNGHSDNTSGNQCQMYGSRASLGPPRPRRSVASGSHQVAEVAIRHW